MDASSVQSKHGVLSGIMWPLALTVVLVLIGMALGFGKFVVAGQNSTAGAASPGAIAANSASGGAPSQTVEGNGVSLTLTWEGQVAGPVFSVSMDTHSGSLDGYDLSQLAVLRTSSGQEVSPVGWDAPTGGHHRKGTLTFPQTGPNNEPLVTAGGGKITVVVRDVADVKERVFVWTP